MTAAAIATVTATSVGNPAVSGSATVKTIAVTLDTLLVDEDGNGPAPDALSFTGSYKVVFLAFPLEAYGTAAQRADVFRRVMSFFGP